MKLWTALFVSALTVNAYAFEAQSYQLAHGAKTCPQELTIIKADECLQLSKLTADAQVEMSEYCQINKGLKTTEIKDEANGGLTTTATNQVEFHNRYLFNQTTIHIAKNGVVTNHSYSEVTLKVEEKKAVMMTKVYQYSLTDFPKLETLACFYSTDAE